MMERNFIYPLKELLNRRNDVIQLMKILVSVPRVFHKIGMHQPKIDSGFVIGALPRLLGKAKLIWPAHDAVRGQTPLVHRIAASEVSGD
jgi:hypothetical protein